MIYIYIIYLMIFEYHVPRDLPILRDTRARHLRHGPSSAPLPGSPATSPGSQALPPARPPSDQNITDQAVEDHAGGNREQIWRNKRWNLAWFFSHDRARRWLVKHRALSFERNNLDITLAPKHGTRAKSRQASSVAELSWWTREQGNDAHLKGSPVR